MLYKEVVNDVNEIVTTSEDNYVIYDIDERGGIMMAASANGIIKSSNGENWRATSLDIPCETIRAIGGERWIASGSSTWISSNNGDSWNKLHFFSSNDLIPSDVVSMPHPEYGSVSSHDITVFGCKNNGGLWVRYYDDKTGGHKFYNPNLFTKGQVSVLSLCYHKTSGWLFAGLDKKINGYTAWMTKDCTKWYPVYTSNGDVTSINVIDSKDNSYIFISDSNVSGYKWGDLKTLEMALYDYHSLLNYDSNGNHIVKVLSNMTWKNSSASTITNASSGYWISSYSLSFTKSKTIKSTDGNETLLMVHEKGIGAVSSANPSIENIIYSYVTENEESITGYPQALSINQNGLLIVGHNIHPDYVDGKDISLYSQPIDNVSFAGSYYILSNDYYKATEGSLHTHSSHSTSKISSNECISKKLETVGDVKTMTECDSTYISSSNIITSVNKGTWIEADASKTYTTYYSFAGSSGADLTSGNVQLLYGDINGGWVGAHGVWTIGRTLSNNWAIGMKCLSGDSTWRNIFTITNTRTYLGVNVKTGKATISYAGSRLLHNTGIDYEWGQRLVFAAFGGFAFLANSDTGEIIKVNTSGLNTTIKLGGTGAFFWTNGGINKMGRGDNRILDLGSIKTAKSSFDVINSIITYEWIEYSNYQNVLQRSIIGNEFTTKFTQTDMEDGFTTFNAISYNKNNGAWYATLGFDNISLESAAPAGIYKSTDDGNTFTHITSTGNISTRYMRYLKNEYALINTDINDGGASVALLTNNDALQTLSYENVRHVIYIPQIDAVVASNGHGNVDSTTTLMKVYPYSDFITGIHTNAKDIMVGADLTTYLPSDFFLIKGKNGMEYLYCCFCDTSLGTYDICRVSVDRLGATLNGEDVSYASYINKDAIRFIFDNHEELINNREYETKLLTVDGTSVTVDELVGISSSEWEEVSTANANGWKNDDAVVLNDVFDGNAIYSASGNTIHKTSAYSGETATLVLTGDTDFGYINRLVTNDDANTLYACTTNGLFHIDVNSTYTTGGDSLRRVQNILSKLGIEEQQ